MSFMDNFKSNFIDKNNLIDRKYSLESFINLSTKNNNKCDISQKIKSLELEGLKLREQVEEILGETASDSWRTSNDQSTESSRTMCDDYARYEPRFKVHQSDFNNSQHLGRGSHFDDNQQHIEHLMLTINENKVASQLEKDKLSATINELRHINNKLLFEIETQMKEFKDSERHQQSIIEKLRINLSQLMNINKRQEETLHESVSKIESLQSSEAAIKAIEYLRELLIDAEYNREESITREYNAESCTPNMLVSTVEKWFKELNGNIDNKDRKIRDLESEIIQMKRTLTHDKEKSLLALKHQLTFTEEQNNYLKLHIEEINEHKDHEIEKLRVENNSIKIKMDEEIESANKLIDSLEQNLQELSSKNKKINESWETEKKSFDKILDDNEKQIAILRAERDQSLNQKSSIIAKLDATQNQLSETETALLQLQSEKYLLEKKVDSSSIHCKEMEVTITYCRKYFDNIYKSFHSKKDDINNYDKNFVNYEKVRLEDDESDDNDNKWRPRKHEFEEIMKQIQCMRRKENDYVCKYEKLMKEYEYTSKQLETIDLNRRQIELSFNAQQLDIESAKNENAHISSLIENRNGEIERLTAERDYYFQLLNEKSEEVASIKTEKYRLAISLEERQNLFELQNDCNQSNQKQRIINTDISFDEKNILREDRNRLIVELKEMKIAYDELLSSLQEEQRNIQMIRQENRGIQKELTNSTEDYEKVLAENKRLLMKLKNSENKISNLCHELQSCNGVKTMKCTSLEKKVSELTTEVTSLKKELKVAHERTKYLEKEESNSKSSKFTILNDLNEKTLSTGKLKITKKRLNNLEKQMSSLDSSQRDLKDENIKLTDLLKKVTAQNERMSEELENYMEENKTLRNQTSLMITNRDCFQNKSESLSKKLKNDSNNIRSYKDTNHKIPSLDIKSADNSNDESIKKLREDLRDSIKGAKQLLSNTDLIQLPENNVTVDDHTPNQSQSGRSNTLNERKSDSIISSSLNTRRSESTSLTEVDRNQNLSVNKTKEYNETIHEKRTISPIEELLAPSESRQLSFRKSNRESYLLQEKIKRILSNEN